MKTLFAWITLSLALPAIAQAPHTQSLVAHPVAMVTRSGNVVTCVENKGCTEEVIGGQHYRVLQTDRFTVKVAMDSEGKYNRADVIVTNRTGYEIHLSPADFRIEVNEPKDKRLSYVEPEKLKLPRQKAKDRLAAAETALKHPILTAEKLVPEASAEGRVFFERSGSARTMSLILPISGAIFEFPYTTAK